MLLSIIMPLMRWSPADILLCDGADDHRLVLGVLAAIGMAGIDDDPRIKSGLLSLYRNRLHAGRIIVGLLAAAQNEVAVLIAARRGNRRQAILGYGREMMRLRGRHDCIEGYLCIAVRPVFETDRA